MHAALSPLMGDYRLLTVKWLTPTSDSLSLAKLVLVHPCECILTCDPALRGRHLMNRRGLEPVKQLLKIPRFSYPALSLQPDSIRTIHRKWIWRIEDAWGYSLVKLFLLRHRTLLKLAFVPWNLSIRLFRVRLSNQSWMWAHATSPQKSGAEISYSCLLERVWLSIEHVKSHICYKSRLLLCCSLSHHQP
jgi:hypothetical protein